MAWILVALLSLVPASRAQQAEPSVETGADPTRLLTIADVKYEFLDLAGGASSGTLRLSYTRPLDAERRWAATARVPFISVDAAGVDDSLALGDASLRVTHVFGLTKSQAWVAQGELVGDTAERPILGTGRNVFKGTLIHARFLASGAIFAPAWVQSIDLGGSSRRNRVDATTLDFYYVPKLADPRNLVTFDPALNFDWQNDLRFASLNVTVGRVIGPAFAGNAIVFVKPTVFAGGDRPGSWGIEMGYRVLGF